ncbi:hypothetical protein H8D85_00835 [bacterium]|nr:hypothetical protein [bacterium]
MKFLEEEIINSLGVPVEFVKGNSSWTGSSVSLRIIENHFLTYRELLLDFVNFFLVPKISSYLNYPEVEVSFRKLKMADDVQAKQGMMNLNNMGKLSDATLLDEYGLDYNKEQDAIEKGKKIFREGIIHDAMAQARSQGEAQVIAAQFQARAQQAMEEEGTKIDAEMFQEELSQETVGIPAEPSKIVEKYAREIFFADPQTQVAYLQQLYSIMPTTAGLVHRRLQQLQGSEGSATAVIPQEQMVMATQQAQMQAVGEGASSDKGKGPTQGVV